ncbi:MAG: hypothetical protein CMO55_18275 [Verrucomicrobiales bacterium]|nr:hypothetical protein [Verrucomicrobiales bacterium]
MNLEDVRCRAELIEAIALGEKPKFLFFWGHTPRVPGEVDQSCLSNWFPAPFSVGEHEYATTEHFMMAEKARLFGDREMEDAILGCTDPGKAKAFGRKVAGFDESVWNRERFAIVVEGNLAKFSQHSEMGDLLKRTGNKVIVEASPRDRIWGIGMGKSNESAEAPSKWRGENLLGFALMEVRSKLA